MPNRHSSEGWLYGNLFFIISSLQCKVIRVVRMKYFHGNYKVTGSHYMIYCEIKFTVVTHPFHVAWIRTPSLLRRHLKSYRWWLRVALVSARCGVPWLGCPPLDKRLSLTCHPDRYTRPHSCRNPCSAPSSRYIHLKGQGKNHHDDAINGSIFCVTGHLCGDFTGHRWIRRTMASDEGLWCFLWPAPE